MILIQKRFKSFFLHAKEKDNLAQFCQQNPSRFRLREGESENRGSTTENNVAPLQSHSKHTHQIINSDSI